MTQTTDYTLAYPLERGKAQLENITIRKPTAGELRGIPLAQLYQMEVDALLKIIPRLTELTEADAFLLDVFDLSNIGGRILSFFTIAPNGSPMTL